MCIWYVNELLNLNKWSNYDREFFDKNVIHDYCIKYFFGYDFGVHCVRRLVGKKDTILLCNIVLKKHFLVIQK